MPGRKFYIKKLGSTHDLTVFSNTGENIDNSNVGLKMKPSANTMPFVEVISYECVRIVDSKDMHACLVVECDCQYTNQ